MKTEKTKHLLIVAPYVSLPGEPCFNRFLYLAHLWSKHYKVTLLTSTFCHVLKQQRVTDNPAWGQLPFELVMLAEPGYTTNVSFGRLVSHHNFVVNLRLWLTQQKSSWRFHLVYSAYPLMATNLALAQFRESVPFKLVIDVQDVWPESIASAIPLLGRFEKLLWPLTKRADRVYASADGLVAVSKTYLDRARSRCPEIPGEVVYLGADRGVVDGIDAIRPPDGVFRLVYVGTLSHSYDLITVVRGVNRMRSRWPKLELHILGDGPHRLKIEKEAGDGVFFHGLLPFGEMVAIAKGCDAAVNPIVASAKQSVTNKLSDYVMMRLPILSSQNNQEVVDLIARLGGEQYRAGSVASFCDAVGRFALRDDLDDVRARTFDLGTELFDRKVTYPAITSFVRAIAES